MKIYQPQSKNILTLMIVAIFAVVGVSIDLAIANYGGPKGTVSPYLSALYPLMFAGMPLLLVSGFIFGIFALGREESTLGRYQAVTLLLFILIIGYLVSYITFNTMSTNGF